MDEILDYKEKLIKLIEANIEKDVNVHDYEARAINYGLRLAINVIEEFKNG